MRTLVVSYIFLFSTALASPARAADRVAGVVVDQAGQLLPRAFVRVLDGSARETASAFSHLVPFGPKATPDWFRKPMA